MIWEKGQDLLRQTVAHMNEQQYFAGKTGVKEMISTLSGVGLALTQLLLCANFYLLLTQAQHFSISFARSVKGHGRNDHAPSDSFH